MRRLLLNMLLLSISFPALAAENEFKFGVTTNTRYNDNVSNVSDDKTDAFIFEVGPRLQFGTRHLKYEAGLSYNPRFTTYSDGGRTDEFTQNMAARAEADLTDRFKVSLRNALTVDYDDDLDISEDVTLDLDDSSEKLTLRNNLVGRARYALSPRGSLNANTTYRVIDREVKDLSDVLSISGELQADYVANMQTTVGIGTSLRTQTVEASRERQETDTDYYGFFLYAGYQFSSSLGFQASGGPTWLLSKREDDGRSGRQTDLEYFASASLEAGLSQGRFSLQYARANSDVAFSATTYLIDQVNATLDWQFTPHVFGGLSAEWNVRTAVLRFAGENFANDVTQWLGAANVSVRVTPEIFMGFTVDYLRQTADNLDAVDRVRGVIRFDYNAQALRL